MIKVALFFLLLAVAAIVLGFFGLIASALATLFKIAFFVFAILFLVFLVLSRREREPD